ncbi:MAG: ribonuclease HI, partial [Xanthomonadaceae bacterium]|nr:ribonuclease HI [Xanthomonadaceae bacterium]
VKGHSGDPDNERVDALARDEAIKFKERVGIA